MLATLQDRMTNPALGVVVNRVAGARAIFDRLRSEVMGEIEVTLIIGPARSVDREDRATELDFIRTGRRDALRLLPKPLVVVTATQTIEAGVDLDFDGLVTEAAALDALRQRFGRLNRAGRGITPEGVILAHKDDIGAKADDPVYGDRIKTTWAKLQHLAAAANGAIDFGISAFRSRIDKEEASRLAAPTADAPIMMPAYADLWSHTWPIPHADPEVALFLNGPDRSPATVQIVWRADIDEQNDLRPAIADKAERTRLIELFKLAPPRAAEAIGVPLWAARAWLEQAGANQANFSDAVERSPEGNEERGEEAKRAFRWAGEDSECTKVVYPSEIKNGDLIAVPATTHGGCDQWGWDPGNPARP